MSAKTIIIDAIFYELCIDTKSVVCKNEYEFYEIIDIILTTKQHKSFVVKETNRSFKVSQKRIDKMFEYINSDNNIWRKSKT